MISALSGSENLTEICRFGSFESTISLDRKSVEWRGDMLPAADHPPARRYHGRPRPTSSPPSAYNSTRNSLYVYQLRPRQWRRQRYGGVAGGGVSNGGLASALSVSLLPGQANHSQEGRSAARFLRNLDKSELDSFRVILCIH